MRLLNQEDYGYRLCTATNRSLRHTLQRQNAYRHFSPQRATEVYTEGHRLISSEHSKLGDMECLSAFLRPLWFCFSFC